MILQLCRRLGVKHVNFIEFGVLGFTSTVPFCWDPKVATKRAQRCFGWNSKQGTVRVHGVFYRYLRGTACNRLDT